LARRELQELLTSCCEATEALARLDARAAAAEAQCAGLILRLAFLEAAGSLPPPRLGPPAGGGRRRAEPCRRSLGSLRPADLGGSLFEALADGDRAAAEALSLAQALPRLAGRTANRARAAAGAAGERDHQRSDEQSAFPHVRD
jgi:hypothetical protein